MNSEIYFDNNATTLVLPEVFEAMRPFLSELYGNPSSIHRFGSQVGQKISEARAQVAALIGAADPVEVIFTSCGTEGDNAAIHAMLEARPDKRHIVTTKVEHPAVYGLCEHLEKKGYRVTWLGVNEGGGLNLDELRDSLSDDTALVSVMHANNETGVIQPVGEIGRITRELAVLFHSDGVQAAGKIPFSVNNLGVDLYSISGHKLNAPKGVGALYVRKGLTLQPLQFGGRHENGRRAGTENVPAAIALGAAVAYREDEAKLLSQVRYRIERRVAAEIPHVMVNGWTAPRLPNTVNISFDGLEGESLVIALDLRGFAVSSGSACSSGAVEPSHVLIAMGLAPEQAKASLRFSVGLGNTVEQADALVDAIAASCVHLRRLSPVYV